MVKRQNFGPDEDQGGPELEGGGLQELEDVGKDADGERQVHGPVAHVQEAAQKLQGPEPVHLTQQHLQPKWMITVTPSFACIEYK